MLFKERNGTNISTYLPTFSTPHFKRMQHISSDGYWHSLLPPCAINLQVGGGGARFRVPRLQSLGNAEITCNLQPSRPMQFITSKRPQCDTANVRISVCVPPYISRLSMRNRRWAVKKGKAIPLEAWTDPEVSKMTRLPNFMTVGT